MTLNYPAKGGGGDFKSVPAGSHIAVCNLIADLGIQPGSGNFPDPKHQVYIRFEVPEERVKYERDGKQYEGPVVIGKTYTASMHEKANLRKDLENWRGRKFTDDEAEAFDIASILGKGCMLSVTEKPKGDKIYTNISAISGLPKGVKAPKAENNLLFYSAEETQAFEALPEWMRKKIKAQLVPQEKEQEDNGYYPTDDDLMRSTEITDDDIPF